MVAAVAVETRQRAKRNKATQAEEEEEKTPSPPPPPPATVRRPRQPTPDHPPYCWMIGEAIDALGEAGGSSEDAISAFIRGAHPGVPDAHDRFLRHYLAKHVAEGLFVCTALGRYARCPDGAAVVEALEEQPPRVETPVTQVKRGRGRPRKDGSFSTSPAGKKGGSSSASPAAEKNGSAGPATPKRRGRPRRVAPLGSGNGSVPAPSAADKNGSQATALAPRRRRRLRKLVTTTCVSSEEGATDNEEDAPSTTGKEPGRSPDLALVVAGDDSTTTETVDDDVCGEGLAVDSDQPHEQVTTIDMPAPMSPPVDKKDGDEEAESLNLALVVNQGAVSTTSTAPEPSNQACKLALVAAEDGPVPVLAAGNTEGDEAPSAMYRRLRQPRAASPMIVAALRCALDPKSAAGKKALPATPSAKSHGRQGELALVATGAYSAPTKIKLKMKPKLYPLTADESHGRQGEPALVVTGAHSTPMKIKPKLYPLTADEIPDDPSWCLLALPAAANAC